MSLTCLVCPNGCGLTLSSDKGKHLVSGNRCIRGVRFARDAFEKRGLRGEFISEVPFVNYTHGQIEEILSLWGLTLEGIDGVSFIPGSPERSLFRTLLKAGETTYILEQIEPERAESHGKTAKRLVRMKGKGLAVTPMIPGRNGKYLQRIEGKIWQLTPFVQGVPLNRNDYWKDAWRGEALGDFLCRLYETVKADGEDAFDLEAFISDLVERITLNRTELLPRLLPVLDRLEKRVFPILKDMPRVFGHGDPHPLNIIWGEDRILSLIDWEFCGAKPLLYDAALVMGCVGSESPDAFDGPFNRAFYGRLVRADIFPSRWLAHLPSFILAQRFAWLNEWLRHGDESMVGQELSYMEMLL